MDSDIKIFFNDRAVVLTGKGTKSSATDNSRVYAFENRKALAKVLERFEQSADAMLYIVHSRPARLLGHAIKCFEYVEAAGGLVTLGDGRILLIRRLGKWDLPKGKAEKGELPQETAIREVMEECGLETPPTITGELAHTYHTYRIDGRRILKHTAWYAMRYGGDSALRPQHSENITDAAWLREEQLDAVMTDTYESVRHVFDKWAKTRRRGNA
jgi:8-oxo-dGTP pyrophosphatase MutT (NUDIX family)